MWINSPIPWTRRCSTAHETAYAAAMLTCTRWAADELGQGYLLQSDEKPSCTQGSLYSQKSKLISRPRKLPVCAREAETEEAQAARHKVRGFNQSRGRSSEGGEVFLCSVRGNYLTQRTVEQIMRFIWKYSTSPSPSSFRAWIHYINAGCLKRLCWSRSVELGIFWSLR